MRSPGSEVAPANNEAEEFKAPDSLDEPENDSFTESKEQVSAPITSVAEVIAQTLVTKRKSPEVSGAPATDQKISNEANSQLLLEQFEAAAEQDIALESHYERRHEVKDEPTHVGAATAIAPAVSWASDDQQALGTDNIQVPQPVGSVRQIASAYKQLLTDPIYKQALGRGIWWGVGLCALTALYILT